MPPTLERLDLVQKTQTVRLLDVVVIGPLMVYGGYRLAASERAAGALLAFFGVTTVLYNARNYARIEAARR